MGTNRSLKLLKIKGVVDKRENARPLQEGKRNEMLRSDRAIAHVLAHVTNQLDPNL